MFRVLIALAGILIGWTSASAQERITSYQSAIEVMADGNIAVTETIAVIAQGDQIQRGIYRDFPTVRGQTGAGGQFRTGFTVLNVTRDGSSEPWFTEPIRDGVRLYIGSRTDLLPQGPHTYVIRYRSDRQIGFFQSHDELYWNVTGNFWNFAIESVAATVTLPEGATISTLRALTGALGATESATSISRTAHVASFVGTRPLARGEGLTVVVTWPKGVVRPPSLIDEITYFVRDNRAITVGGAAFALLMAFYGLAWLRVGRDPDGGVIIAQYEPPQGLSPAACRYIDRMDWDEKAFTAALVDLATRRLITIEKLSASTTVLTRTDMPVVKSAVFKGERTVLDRLFPGEWTSLPLLQEHHATVQSAIDGLKRSLEAEHEYVHFLKNRSVFYTGLMFSLVAIVTMFLVGYHDAAQVFAGLITGGVVAVVYGLIKYRSLAVGIGRAGLSVGVHVGVRFLRLIPALVAGAFALPTISEILDITLSPASAICTAIIVTNVFFLEAMKAPTHLGRKLMDHIEGFRLYLTVAEKDRLNFHNPPDVTPKLFETYLPYAIALNVENEWGDQFNDAMVRIARAAGSSWDNESYAPRWSRGWSSGSRLGASMADLSSGLSGSIATAVSAPSANSGSGAGLSGGRSGGFSGGGGGGGGGGGW